MTKQEVEITKMLFPAGTRIELIGMEAHHPVPAGTKGTVVSVDDMGTIHVQWDNGRRLGVIPCEDRFRKICSR